MFQENSMFRRLIALAFLLAVAACGGGGSSETFVPPNAAFVASRLVSDYGYAEFYVSGGQGAIPQAISINLNKVTSGTYITGGQICIRESGSSSACGGRHTTLPQFLRATGGKYTFDVSALESVRTLRRGETLHLEFLIVNYPYFWTNSDMLQLSIEYIEYFFDGQSPMVDYTRVPAATTTLYKW